MLPLGFGPLSWFRPKFLDNYVFTTVNPDEIWPLSSLLTTNIEYADIMHTLFGFRVCYMLCLLVSNTLVGIVLNVFKVK